MPWRRIVGPGGLALLLIAASLGLDSPRGGFPFCSRLQAQPSPKTEEPKQEPTQPEPAQRNAADTSQPDRGPEQSNQPDASAQSNLFAQGNTQGPSGSSGTGSGHPTMVGDLNGGIFVHRLLAFPTNQLQTVRILTNNFLTETTTLSTLQTKVPGALIQDVVVPLAIRGPFKISENESPFPMTRVYTTYNYFGNEAVLPGGLSHFVPTGAANPPLPNNSNPLIVNEVLATNITGFEPASLSIRRLDVHRETFGFEWAPLDANFSVGLRVPLIQQTGLPAFENSLLGDLTGVFKYALINDRDTGNVLSAGLAVTAPTGQDVIAANGVTIHSTLLQPYLGVFVNLGEFYIQGFSAIIVPTGSNDATLVTNDVGVGYRLLDNRTGDSFLRSVTPTLEGHLTTPVNQRGALHFPAGFPDILIGTAAVHIGLGQRSTLTVGATTPFTGPLPFHVEAIAQLNVVF